MTDAQQRRKVLDGLELCLKGLSDLCPYKDSDAPGGCRDELMYDAMVLLKAQEPVEPVVDIDTWKCGKCGHTLEHQELLGDNVLFHEQYNYCPECGMAVKWYGDD